MEMEKFMAREHTRSQAKQVSDLNNWLCKSGDIAAMKRVEDLQEELMRILGVWEMSGPFDKSFAGGEFFKNKERDDGTRDLFFGQTKGEKHGHAVFYKNGNLRFLRESDGSIIADDSIPRGS